MPKIKLLSPQEAQKIAAGQVIERPANAIKELLENAIDAGASRISIYIEDGGKQRMRIVDNGHGMDKTDAKSCLQKHATSKIRSIDELVSITSYGFRGEALASIAAVAKVAILTKEKESSEGTKALAHEGIISTEPIACPEGTDITVTDLFYNVPARAKFLKKRETETRHIIQIIQAMSLTYPSHHLQLFVNNKLFINCPPQKDVISRCAQLWGQATAQHMIALETEQNQKGITISGAISNHNWFRYDRRTIFFLVNNRWVTNPQLGRALLKGYNNVLPLGRYPTACISIQIDPEQIDINTHPKKEEVMFAHPRTVEQLIYKAVRTALEKGVSKQIKRDISFAQPEYNTSPLPSAPFSDFDATLYPSDHIAAQQPVSEKQESASPFTYKSQVTLPYAHEPTVQQKNINLYTPIEQAKESYKLIGQFHKTYLLIEQEEGLYLIDQHAAHERILYELFATRFDQLPTIQLMFPQLIPCSQDDLAIIEPHLNIFRNHGIAVEPFGKYQLIIKATPVHLKNSSFDDLIKQVIGWIQEYSNVDQEQFIKTVHDKLRAQMACKAAVKAGDTLSLEQMQELLEDLHTCPNRFSCPHGRPTGFLFALHDIEKRFRRR